MKVLLCGSRGWVDPTPVEKVLDMLAHEAATRGEPLVVIQGAAPGLDRLLAHMARKRSASVVTIPTDLEQHGKDASSIRNQKMIDEGPEAVYAFRTTGKSRDTEDILERAQRAGIPTTIAWSSP